MNREAFDTLVQGIEDRYQGRPKVLERRALFWALLGYGYFLGVFLIFLGLASGVFAWWRQEHFSTLGPPLLGVCFLWVGLNSLLQAISTPDAPDDGVELTAARAPEFFKRLDALALRLDCAPFHRVWLELDVNAAVVQRPRFGLLGGWRNELRIGLPLLECCSTSEIEAILAHEFAHLSKRHGRMGHWIYNLRKSWGQTFDSWSSGRVRPDATVRSFVEWYWPRFNAHAFVLSRSHEFEADRLAAEACGPANLARALARVACGARIVDEDFWKPLWSRAGREPTPPEDPLAGLPAVMEASRPRVVGLIEMALKEAPANLDTHPVLAARIQALGTTAFAVHQEIANKSFRSAAGELLGGELNSLRKELGNQWRKEALRNWQTRNLGQREADNQAHARKVSTVGSEDPKIRWEQAENLIRLGQDAEAAEHLEVVLRGDSKHALASFHYGRILLEKMDGRGVVHVENAIASDSALFPTASGVLFGFYKQTGESARLQALRKRADEFESTSRLADEERRSISPKDTFIAHELPPDILTSIRLFCEARPRIRAVHLAQKQMAHFKEQKMHLISITTGPSWPPWRREDLDAAIVAEFRREIQPPGRMFVFMRNGEYKGVARKMEKVPGSEIYGRK